MKIGFVVWNPFMVYHMKAIAENVPSAEFLVLDNQPNVDVRALFGSAFETVFGFNHRVVTPKELESMDGEFDAVVCPNPIAGMERLRRTKCIGMQYSMAKDRYVNGPWRAMFDLTMTYGRYSAERIAPFCPTAMVGNPRFDRWFSDDPPRAPADLRLDSSRPVILYLPTWGEFSSVDQFMSAIIDLADEYNVLLKVHHKTDTHEPARKAIAASGERVHFFGALDDLLPLLAVADVILSDYSGAIFDAIYVRKPVVLLQADPASVVGKKFGFESIEYARRNEIGPVVSSPHDLRGVLAAHFRGELDYREKNERLRAEIFEYDADSGAIAARAIEEFLEHPPERPLYQIYLRDELRALRYRQRQQQEKLRQLEVRLKAAEKEGAKKKNFRSKESSDSRGMKHFVEGLQKERQRKWKAAATAYRAAVQCSGRAEWYARLGYVLEQRKRWEEAESAYEEAIRRFGRR